MKPVSAVSLMKAGSLPLKLLEVACIALAALPARRAANAIAARIEEPVGFPLMDADLLAGR